MSPRALPPLPEALEAEAGDEARELLAWEASGRVWQAAHALPAVAFRRQLMSLNARPSRPVMDTERRAYWRRVGAYLYPQLRDVATGERGPVATREDPARVLVFYGFPNLGTGARDPVNLSGVTKALVDGLVDGPHRPAGAAPSGLAADDHAGLIVGQDSRRLATRTPAGQVLVLVTVQGGAPREAGGGLHPDPSR